MAKRRARPAGKPTHQRGGYRRHRGYYHRAREEGYAARSVYKLNDRRAALKRAVNEALGSELVEQKDYVDY